MSSGSCPPAFCSTAVPGVQGAESLPVLAAHPCHRPDFSSQIHKPQAADEALMRLPASCDTRIEKQELFWHLFLKVQHFAVYSPWADLRPAAAVCLAAAPPAR